MKLRIVSDDRDHAILVGDEDSNDIAEFYHADHATVGQSYETALALAKRLVEGSGAPAQGSPNPADEIIGQIEERFPDWKGFRDLVDCIDVTLHRLRGGR